MSQATIFPVQNQAFEIPVSFRDVMGNLIQGWTGATSTISIDGGTPTAGNAPVENSGLGFGLLQLTSAQMNGQLIQVKCSITNTSGTAFLATIYTTPMTENVHAWDAQTLKRLEDVLFDVAKVALNTNSLTASAYQVNNRDETLALSGSMLESDDSAVRGKLS